MAVSFCDGGGVGDFVPQLDDSEEQAEVSSGLPFVFPNFDGALFRMV